MIAVHEMTKLYGTFTAVRRISFEVHPGEVLGLVGPNGAGKTTTLRCLAGIIPASAGAIRIAGQDLPAAPVAAKRMRSFSPEDPRLFESLTVRQHLNFVARVYGVPEHEKIAQPLLDEFEIAD